MKELRPSLFSFPQNNIPEELTMCKDFTASADSGIGNTELSEIGDPSHSDVEKDIYALIDFCVHLLKLETKKNEISRMQGKDRDLNSQTAAMLKKKKNSLRRVISASRKRLRCNDTNEALPLRKVSSVDVQPVA